MKMKNEYTGNVWFHFVWNRSRDTGCWSNLYAKWVSAILNCCRRPALATTFITGSKAFLVCRPNCCDAKTPGTMSASSRETSTWSNRSQLQCDFFIIRKIFKNKKQYYVPSLFSSDSMSLLFKNRNVCTTFCFSLPNIPHPQKKR